ncbi:head-tail joining protein [Burkholderia phage vB_BceS_AH2]|uniref:Head-tail joining protein n=1 Tax=Burkholderia phage vB_BceS_AH2 TaxID=1133022 RepID=I6NSS9_9CAUD|nr:head-tail adaptor Ad1 [Burkholderia phage vB_BceS_AH2]AEY69576.1 head-tail joining protein [Burkholderia phage vB_BceS_AH2]
MACDPAKLQAARDAYDALMTGKMARVVVDQNGERVEFVAANAQRLLAYINSLQAECDAAASGAVRARGPFNFVF